MVIVTRRPEHILCFIRVQALFQLFPDIQLRCNSRPPKVPQSMVFNHDILLVFHRGDYTADSDPSFPVPKPQIDAITAENESGEKEDHNKCETVITRNDKVLSGCIYHYDTRRW